MGSRLFNQQFNRHSSAFVGTGLKKCRLFPYCPSEMIVTDRGKVAITASEGERLFRTLNSASFTSAYGSWCLLGVLRINLWRLFANFPRIDDELERIRVLILFHQLQIGEALSAFYRIATRKPRLHGFDQIRCNRILPVCGKTVRCFDDLRLREAQIVNEKFCAIQPARMSQTMEVRLPVPNVLIIDSVDHMLAHDVVRLMGIGLMGQEIRRDEV